MMEQGRRFLFNCEWRDTLSGFPPETRLRVYEAAIDYADAGVLPDLDPVAAVAFSFIRREIDYYTESYNKACARRAEAAKKAAAMRWHANACEGMQTHAVDAINKDKDKDEDKNKDKDIKKETIKKEIKRFVKPTVDEVRAYCNERKNNVNPSVFVDFYESKGWKVGTNPMKDWKAAVRTWEQSRKRGLPKNATFQPLPTSYEEDKKIGFQV